MTTQRKEQFYSKANENLSKGCKRKKRNCISHEQILNRLFAIPVFTAIFLVLVGLSLYVFTEREPVFSEIILRQEQKAEMKAVEGTRITAPVEEAELEKPDVLRIVNIDSVKANSAGTATADAFSYEWYTQEEVDVLAKTVYGEALITHSDMEMAAVVWCILNRVDDPRFPDDIVEVATAEKQFHGYSADNPVLPEIEELVKDVLARWHCEKVGDENVGRVLPEEYIYFWGDGRHNYFTIEYHGAQKWGWEVYNPYEN